MTEPLKKTNHLVLIYYYKGNFFVMGAVEMPPIFVWREVNPVYKVERNKEKLIEAIDSARLQSISRFHSGHDNPEIKPWNGEKIWNSASRSWSIWWNEDGSVEISTDEPYNPNEPDLGEGKAWRAIKDLRKILPPPITFEDIAQEILNNL